MSIWKKILCPTDFSEISYEGLKKAVDLVEGGATEICLLYVDQPLHAITKTTPLAVENNESVMRAEAVSNLQNVLSERLPKNVRAQPLLRSGVAGAEIVRAAREENCDLIVLTTHGAQGWREGVLGSVAEHVLRHASCPVLTVSGPATGHPYVSDALLRQINGHMKPELAINTEHKIYLDGD